VVPFELMISPSSLSSSTSVVTTTSKGPYTEDILHWMFDKGRNKSIANNLIFTLLCSSFSNNNNKKKNICMDSNNLWENKHRDFSTKVCKGLYCGLRSACPSMFPSILI